ncbi:hypothetical protein SeMB42_g01991 [Synchytrium endobioticum]|uniref:Uncharacterized protein n=1 Tax=Synchytrium endobioticum TaxID=286115 RepID=A0A507DHR0_9FUNG|nr:hypothetical protein SeMB42_g01991 [Synchytrium endobioticum]
MKDIFNWNLHEQVTSPEHFARMTVQDMDVPTEVAAKFAPMIAHAIRDQCRELAAAVEDEEAQYAAVDESERIIVKLDMNVGQLHLTDQFEWPLFTQPDVSPEDYAQKTCADLGIAGEFAPAIAVAVRDQVAHARLAYGNDALAASLRAPPFERLANAPVRNEGNEDQWQPNLQELTQDDMERMAKEKERETRLARRNQQRVSRTSSHSMATAMTASAALVDFNNRMTRQRMHMGIQPKHIPYQKYLPSDDELRVQREHVHKYLPSGSDLIHEFPAPHGTNQTATTNDQSARPNLLDSNLPSSPHAFESALANSNNLSTLSNTGIPHRPTPPPPPPPAQLHPSALPPTFYLSPFGASPFLSSPYPSPPPHYGLPMSALSHHNGPLPSPSFAGQIPHHLLQFPPGVMSMSLSVGLGSHGLPPLPPQIVTSAPMKKSSKKASPTPVDQELLARQLLLLANQTPPPGPPSPTKSVDGDGAPTAPLKLVNSERTGSALGAISPASSHRPCERDRSEARRYVMHVGFGLASTGPFRRTDITNTLTIVELTIVFETLSNTHPNYDLISRPVCSPALPMSRHCFILCSVSDICLSCLSP